MTLHWPAKSPSQSADYDLDWSGDLATGDTITNSTWTIVGSPSSLTMSNSVWSSNGTKVTLSGGTPNATYTLINVITTLLCPSLVKSVSVLIK